MEGDGPTGCMVLRKYYQLKKNLTKKLAQSLRTDTLYPMYLAMLTSVEKYLAEALECETIIMATVLHPSWRTDFFATAFGQESSEFKIASYLLESHFARRRSSLQSENAEHGQAADEPRHGDDSDDETFNLRRKQKTQPVRDELAQWLQADNAPDEEVDLDPKKALIWWKVSRISGLVLHVYQKVLISKFLSRIISLATQSCPP